MHVVCPTCEEDERRHRLKEWKSEIGDYKAVLRDDGLLKVYNGPKVLRETRSDGAGGVTVTEHTLETATGTTHKLLSAMTGKPVFSVCWGGKLWLVDIDCGMQRFNGQKPNRELTRAFQNCGFDEDTIKVMITHLKRFKWDHCPREY
jgi:hypothetical protein